MFFCLLLIPAALHLLACQQKAQIDPRLVLAFPNLSFSQPVDLQTMPGNADVLFVAEKKGKIYSFDNQEKTREKKLLLDISQRVYNKKNNGGLLSFTFHPRFSQTGSFFVHYMADNPRRNIVSSFHFNSRVPIEQTEKIILEIESIPSNNNGGQILFGPDGMLYVTLGDVQAHDNSSHLSQDPKSLFGKILRLDVDAVADKKGYAIPKDNPFYSGQGKFRKEVYAYGFRNPWRCSFDKLTEYLWCGDIGEHGVEEINVVLPGKNYGWPLSEGGTCIKEGQCEGVMIAWPVLSYSHEIGDSVIGGMVYRGDLHPNLSGHYIYADFNAGSLWSVSLDEKSNPSQVNILAESSLKISSLAHGLQGDIYIVSYSGQIYKLAKPIL